ncbi:hypothetical protein K1T71_012915 [Dendrolimus kikuchii]|uniref:Uncharacterized protein n=1 Tax=Dendrolimus kikuchii TaxID=765133 RepID=A0ACC1CIF8_9NEOP|nr:hypothetical protein K1T71_012915 [Dendrolimus kikuchii]
MKATMLFILLLATQAWGQNVETPSGPVHGQIATYRNVSYYTYLGVPYAKVDVHNPFGASQPYPNFDTPFNATDHTVKCPQVALTPGGITQCLRLNIFTPVTASPKNLLPVFVWFHGGGFFFGNSGDYDGRYFMQHDIIVVAANYRLGPYGFFCLDDPHIPGNQGLKDQIDALRWVKKNIGAFGGDASKVTIGGESYGGGSVDLHVYSLYEKLFDKAIVQSGTLHAEAIFVKPDYNAPIKLAAYLGHNTTNNKEALEFLAKEDPIKVVTAQMSMSLLLRACKEKKYKGVQNFIASDPFHLQNSQKVKDMSILFGYNSKETFGAVANIPDSVFDDAKNIFTDKINSTFVLRKHELHVLANNVKKFYIGGKDVSKESMLALVDFTADYTLNYGAERSVDDYVKQGVGKVYKYLFSYTKGSPYENITGVGAYHTEELQYLFYMGTELKTEQIGMMDKLTKLWSDFIKYGNPTPSQSLLDVPTWIPVTNGTARPYMNIDSTMEMKADVYHERIAFWDMIWHHHWRKSAILVDRNHHD